MDREELGKRVAEAIQAADATATDGMFAGGSTWKGGYRHVVLCRDHLEEGETGEPIQDGVCDQCATAAGVLMATVSWEQPSLL